jgi:hypothetical protein
MAAAPQSSASALSGKWIINARWDSLTCLSTIWFPALLYVAWRALDRTGFDAGTVTVIAFTAAVSWPHFMTTLTFTFMDPEQRAVYRQRPVTHIWIPALIMLGSWIYCASVGPVLLVTIWVLYGEQHLAAQNIGFLALYRRRNGEGELDRKLDHLVFNTAWIATALSYGTRPIDGAGLVYLGLPAYSLPIPHHTEVLLVAILVALAAFVVHLGRQLQRWLRNEPVSLPKLLFMLTTWPSFLLVLVLVQDLAVVQIVRSGYHSVQYLMLVHLLNQRRVAARPAPRRDLLAWLVKGGMARYLLIHAAVGIAVWWFSERVAYRFDVGRDLSLRYLFFPGFVIMHYYMDGLTWRFSDPEARRTVLPYLEQRPPAVRGLAHGTS